MMQHTEVRDPNDYDEDDDDSESHHPEQPRRIECIDKKLDEMTDCLVTLRRDALQGISISAVPFLRCLHVYLRRTTSTRQELGR